jgi:hypothetical protein
MPLMNGYEGPHSYVNFRKGKHTNYTTAGAEKRRKRKMHFAGMNDYIKTNCKKELLKKKLALG